MRGGEGEHLKGCREEKEDNALWKHLEGEHRGEDKGDEIFSMRVEKSFQKPLARQIREGVEIEMSRATLLNSKSECNNSRIPRIIIENGEKQVEDRESGFGNQIERDRQKRRTERQIEIRERKEKRKEGTETDEAKVDRLESKRRKVLEEREPTRGSQREKEARKMSKGLNEHQKEVRRTKLQQRAVDKVKKGLEASRADGIDFWKSEFQKMAERNRERRGGVFEIRGVQQHTQRIEKGRESEVRANSRVDIEGRENATEYTSEIENEITREVEERNREIEREFREAEKIERIKRKEKKEGKWAVKRKEDSKLTEIIVTDVSNTIDNSKKIEQTEIEGESENVDLDIEVRSVKKDIKIVKVRKLRISPEIDKIRKVFEKEKGETEVISRVQNIKNSFELLMDPRKREIETREDREREKKRVDRKDKKGQRQKIEAAKSRVSTIRERFKTESTEGGRHKFF